MNKTSISVRGFMDVKAGDTVVRMLAGTARMELKVKEIDDTLIYCHGGWMFERHNGGEYDPDLEWGSKWGGTGSYLVKESSDS